MDWKRGIKSYSSIITKNIPLFLAVGFLNIFFSDSGWFPNKAMSAMADTMYAMIIPVLLGYSGGMKTGKQSGGIAGAIASAGFVSAGAASSMMGAILIGGAAGYLTGIFHKYLEKKIPSGFEMMIQNLVIAAAGVVAGGISYFVLAPCLAVFDKALFFGLDKMMAPGLLPLVNLVVEPLKIFFLNNCLNHGIFIPLGMEQLHETGKSVLFLVESNPGPGLGILLACFLLHREERRDTLPVMAVHFLGGIHEVYFPYILTDIRLLAAVMAGGTAGTLCFDLLNVGLRGPVSPGSILTILLMAGAEEWAGVLIGAAVSAAVSLGVALLLIGGRRKGGERKQEKEAQKESSPMINETEKKQIRRIYVVCDAGLGSSAMGAALLRRKLKDAGAADVAVRAAALDDIPDDADLLVCQKDFYVQKFKGRSRVELFQVERLTDGKSYEGLIEKLKGRI